MKYILCHTKETFEKYVDKLVSQNIEIGKAEERDGKEGLIGWLDGEAYEILIESRLLKL